MDGSLGCGVALKVVFKLCDDCGGGKQAAVIGKRGEPHENSFVFECRNAVADGFGGSARRGGVNCRAHLAQGAARRLRSCREVFGEILRRLFGFRRGAAPGRFSFLHGPMLQELSLQIQVQRNRMAELGCLHVHGPRNRQAGSGAPNVGFAGEAQESKKQIPHRHSHKGVGLGSE